MLLFARVSFYLLLYFLCFLFYPLPDLVCLLFYALGRLLHLLVYLLLYLLLSLLHLLLYLFFYSRSASCRPKRREHRDHESSASPSLDVNLDSAASPGTTL